MQAGRLRNLGAIEQNTPTRDAIGGEVASWAAFVSGWWFELLPVSGAERVRGRTVHAQANYLAIGRYTSGVTTKMRLTLGSRIFDILAALDPDGRTVELRLDLLERNV